MNKITKFIIGGIAAFSLNAVLAKATGKNQSEPTPPAPKTDPKPDTPTRNANINLELKKGSTGYEVKLLQQKLGVSPDGVFGIRTEEALFLVTGVKSVTLANFEGIKATFQSKLTKQQLKTKYEKQFPRMKQVIALVEFEAFVAVYRNGNWFSTDLDGKQLPSVVFKKTAQVGAVYSYDYQDPSIIILALPFQVPHNVYKIPVNQTYNKIRVKASWIK